MNARQVVAQLQREKKELARKLEKQQYDLKLVKMERSLDIQRKHEKEAEESYLLELETELNKRIAELQPSLENLEQKKRKLEYDIEMLSKEVRFLQKTTSQYSSELNQWLDYQVEGLHPTTQKLVRKSRDMARKTWQNLLTAVDANKILTDHVASEFDKYFQMRDKSIESGVLFHLLILIPIICVVRFLFQFTQIAKSQITCKTLILVICGYQMMVCLLFYFFFFVSGIDPLILIQRHYANLLGIFVMTVMLSLIVLAGCFIILYWKLRYHNIISSLFGIGSITFHFYWCIFKPVLLDDPLTATGSIYLIYFTILYFIIMDFVPAASWDILQSVQQWLGVLLVIREYDPTKTYCAIKEKGAYYSQTVWSSNRQLFDNFIGIQWKIRNLSSKLGIALQHLWRYWRHFITKKSDWAFSRQSPKLATLVTSSSNCSVHTCRLVNDESIPSLRRENSSNRFVSTISFCDEAQLESSLRSLPW
ncbi:hypothetical protein GAYE_PCTG69G1453 [Galdieria yellowstonensis]|uniref:Uncharacterized protein n=1 Tax=Galdieria yellowstonensis TaxID=3028027 RepID=A0AAV9I881_9RHOD|nr:hypothetical protein GAYE_PCTG69G1453 [Galdieria yellowstonensis]